MAGEEEGRILQTIPVQVVGVEAEMPAEPMQPGMAPGQRRKRKVVAFLFGAHVQVYDLKPVEGKVPDWFVKQLREKLDIPTPEDEKPKPKRGEERAAQG